MQQNILVVDGNSLMNRAYYGISANVNLKSHDGTPTGAVTGFFNTLFSYLDKLLPSAVNVVFDRHEKTFRHAIYQEYKGNRSPAPPEMLVQFPIVKDLLRAMGFKVWEKAGFEADDLAGTIAEFCKRQQQVSTYLLTGDKDYFQLIDEQVTVCYMQSSKNGGDIMLTPVLLEEKYGVSPASWLDVKALMGDSSDNVPGVKGVGNKTAVKLINEYGSLDKLYQSQKLPKGKLGENLEADRAKAMLAYELCKIKRDVAFNSEEQSEFLQSGEKDASRLKALIEAYDLRRLRDKISTCADLSRSEAEPAKGITALKVKEFVAATDFSEFMARLLQNHTGSFIAAQEGLVILTAGTYIRVKDLDSLYELLQPYQNEEFTLYTWDVKKLLHTANTAQPYRFYEDLLIDGYLLQINNRQSDISYTLKALLADAYEKTEDELAELWQLNLAGKLAHEKLAAFKLDYLCAVENDLVGVLAAMEKRGFLIDRAALKAAEKTYEQEISALEQEIFLYAGNEFNLNSQQQLSDVLFEKLGLPHGKKRKYGYSTDSKELQKLRGASPIVDLILEYRECSKLYNTFLVGLDKELDAENRVHTTFNQVVTATGRLSSSNPNLQNIPVRTERGKLIRKFFCAPEGRVLIDADYSQIELRILAHVSGDPTMMSAFLNGDDIHRAMAAELYNVKTAEVTSTQRAAAKTVNFSITYGISAFGLSQNLRVPVYEAQHLIEKYRELYPKVVACLDNLGKQAQSAGYVTTLLGRRRNFDNLNSANYAVRQQALRAAMNAPIQGTAADLIKIAMVRVAKRYKREGLDAFLLLQVHDELIVEASKADAEAAKAVLCEEMENAYKLAVPLVVDAGIGSNWSEIH